MENTNYVELYEHGGDWLRATRDYLKSNVPNGDSIVWGSADVVQITARQIEVLAAKASAAAINEYIKQQQQNKPQLVEQESTKFRSMEFTTNSEHHSTVIQYYLFKLGYKWGSIGSSIRTDNKKYIQVWHDGIITHCDTTRAKAESFVPTTLHELIKMVDADALDYSMDTNATEGSLVTFLGKNGYSNELERAKLLFNTNNVYEVEYVDECTTSCWAKFKGIDGMYNTVMFANV